MNLETIAIGIFAIPVSILTLALILFIINMCLLGLLWVLFHLKDTISLFTMLKDKK